ncbi:MAG: putative GTP cyclohydrolase 1 type 2 [Lentisphaerae bacterium ADurb.BinA184]|nr:MAG: putative GTP cyclohydrolase 1 type 2 [Lentisphaerae bacterium ADurb.BinA184]
MPTTASTPVAPRAEIVRFLDDLLRPPPACEDSSRNGLQVEGRPEVRRIAFGVDACQALFDAAVAESADFVVVHHGLIWGGGLRDVAGINARRLGTLLGHGISLYASHLPLDMHPEVGHNAEIARRLDLRGRQPFFEYGGVPIGCQGELPTPHSLPELRALVERHLRTETRALPFGPDTVRRVGIVSGGGGDAIAAAAEAGLDGLITGEVGHANYHVARENRLHVIAAGHYRSEIPGLECLMARLRERFGVAGVFLDLPTGC